MTPDLPADIAAIIQLSKGDASGACALLRKHATTPRLDEAIADALEKAKLSKPRGAPRKRSVGEEASLAQVAEWELERLCMKEGITKTRALEDVAKSLGLSNAEQLDSLLKARRGAKRQPTDGVYDDPMGVRNTRDRQGK